MGILITGGTGFIGKRLFEALKNDHNIIRIVSRNTSDQYKDLITCDLSRNNLSIDNLKDITTIFHLAAYTHDLRSPNKLEDVYRSINVSATVKLAKIAIEANVKRFIFISSSKAGEPNIKNQEDNNFFTQQPQGVYGKTKREAEIRLLDIAKESSMKVDIIRPTLVYGPGVKGNLEQMLKAINKGWFPPLPDVKNCRSMIHVDDLIRAILLIEKKKDSNGRIYIATDGQKYSSTMIYETLCKVLGRSIPNWKLPLSVLKILSFINPNFRYKIEKLIGDEYYSSAQLESIGFKPKFTLREINEKIF